MSARGVTRPHLKVAPSKMMATSQMTETPQTATPTPTPVTLPPNFQSRHVAVFEEPPAAVLHTETVNTVTITEAEYHGLLHDLAVAKKRRGTMVRLYYERKTRPPRTAVRSRAA